jgi:transposase
MDHLDEISVEELQGALDNVEGNKPTQRLLAAIAYKNGVTQTELAEWHDTSRRTIYSWLMRLDTDEPLEQAVSDAHRSGRKRKLSESQQKEFEQAVHEPPEEVGIDAPAWAPALVKEFLEDRYGVEYSYPSCRRLLKEAGLSYQKHRRSAAEAEESDQEAFHDEIKKTSGDGRQSSLHRPNQEICPGQAAWFPRGTWPSVELSEQRDWTCLLGAITEDGERFFSRFTEYVTTDHAKHFIVALCEEFEDDLIVVLDGASYFQASVVTLPSYSPELNPVEECWRQLQDGLSNRFFDSLDELTAVIDTALDQLLLPTVSNYF